MKTFTTLAFLLPFLLVPVLVQGQSESENEESESKPGMALDEVLFSDDLWSMSLSSIMDRYKEKETENGSANTQGLPKELIAQLKEKGIEIGGMTASGGGFDWLSSQKQGLRSPPEGDFTLLDKEIGEVVIRSNGESVGSASISIFNKGDDGTMPKSEFLTKLNEWKSSLDQKIGERPQSRDQAGAVAVKGWMWRKGNSAFLLEGSITRRDNQAEFIRLRMMPLNGAMAPKTKVTRRGDLDENVTTAENGDVLIKGIPMVDQGDKGYCVVATVERVARYYGLQVDQHELAQLANTDRYGTSGDDMEEAFKKLTGKVHARTLKLIDYDQKQFERDYTSYNRAAKREGVYVFKEDLDEWIIDPRWFWSKADTGVFKKMKAEQNKFDFFFGKIEEYIDQGVPICWSLYLGMFKEDDSPQMYGGHMRMIYGYNKAKKEILYTDSWGEGHEAKRMSADEAWCMTMGIYTMLPNR